MSPAETRLRQLLRDEPLDGAAEQRSLEVVRAAFEAREPVARRRGGLRLTLATAGAVLVAVLAAVTPTREAVADWIEDVVRPGAREAAPALDSLPAPGRLLVQAPSGPWVVNRDGAKRRLGDYDAASWSPGGLYVVATGGRTLTAVEPDGDVRWSISRSGPVSGARWAPSGYRIAYLAGRRPELRVVAGDGTGDRLFDRRAAPAAPAWRPGARHVLAYAKPDGSIAIADADTRVRLGRSAAGEAPRELAWSGDGRRLVARGAHTLRILDGRGQLLAAVSLTAGAASSGAARTVAFRGRGHELALVRSGPGGRASEVVLLRAERSPGRARRLFAGPGALGDLAWSPDGRWLLVSWPSANQWVFIRPTRSPRVRAVADISREFDPGGGRELPGRVEWCCVR
jgi:hypothetical protein